MTSRTQIDPTFSQRIILIRYIMAWSQIEATPAHLTYLILTTFLLCYALFSQFIRNRLHLAEPPFATLFGVIIGPKGLDVVDPVEWFGEDDITEEITRIVVGVQVFVVGLELPRRWLKTRLRSLLMQLGPVMMISYVVTAVLVRYIVSTKWDTAFVVSACLAPTDPVLAASVLGNSHFSERIPKRLRDLLGAESGCNDGVSFPFLFLPLFLMIKSGTGEALKTWTLITLLYSCVFGLTLGVVIGRSANWILKVCERRELIDPASFLAFYLLLAVFSIGVGSTLGSDDFLVAFGAGAGFSYDGWFAKQVKNTHLPSVIDLILNSGFFIYFGAIIPWASFSSDLTGLTVIRLLGLTVAILVLRRLPGMLLLYKAIPEIKSLREAVFCGFFGPMGVGAIFLAMTARAQLESGDSVPLPNPPKHSPHKIAIETIWPVVAFVVFGSILVHGSSTGFISVYGHYSRNQGDRASLVGAEQGLLDGFVDSDYGSNAGSEQEL